jgi:DNA polymerase III alpha subunit
VVTIPAWPVTAKIVETKDGNAMMFQSFEDAGAICEAVIFPDAFQCYHRLLAVRQPLWVTGRVEEEFAVPTLQVMGVERIIDANPLTASPSDRMVGVPPEKMPHRRAAQLEYM